MLPSDPFPTEQMDAGMAAAGWKDTERRQTDREMIQLSAQIKGIDRCGNR